MTGAVAAVAIVAAFDRASCPGAGVVVAISMISFLLLHVTNGTPPALRTIAREDLIGLPILAYALWDAFVRH